jgi:predicted dehydrogenase
MRTGTFKRVAPDAAAVIADPDVDAVVIATRHSSHAPLVEQALKAGKHVFCEKPLALTIDEYESVMRAAEESDRILLVGFNRRFSPLLRQMRAHLSASGRPMILTYRVSAGNLGEDHWTQDISEGGGRALGEGCHFVDSLAFLAGSPVTEVYAVGHGPKERAVQAYDNLIITLRFAGGSVGSVVYVADGSPQVPKERLEGFSGARTAILDDYRRLQKLSGGDSDAEELKSQDKGHRQEVAEFLHGVLSGSSPVDLAQLGNSSLATLGVIESLRTGEPVRLNSC